MLDLDSLRNTIRDRYDEIVNKQKLIDSIMNSADIHEQNGDTAQADQERKSAQRYIDEIEIIKKNVGLLELELNARIQKVTSLEGRIKEKREQAQKEIESLEQELKNVA